MILATNGAPRKLADNARHQTPKRGVPPQRLGLACSERGAADSRGAPFSTAPMVSSFRTATIRKQSRQTNSNRALIVIFARSPRLDVRPHRPPSVGFET
jgi:hypothetical protein